MPKTSACDSHKTCLQKIWRGQEIPERAYCYLNRCMQRKSAITDFMKRRKQLKYLLKKHRNDYKKTKELTHLLNTQLKREQEHLKELLLAELKNKALQTSMRTKADAARAQAAPRQEKARAAEEQARRGSGGSLPVFVLRKDEVPYVIVPMSVKRAMEEITDCATQMSLPFSRSFNKEHTDPAIVAMSRIGDMPVTLDQLYVRIDGKEFIEMEDHIFWFLGSFKRDLKDAQNRGKLIGDCLTYKESVRRVDQWLSRANARLIS